MWLQLNRNRSRCDALAFARQQPKGADMIIGYITLALVGAFGSSALMWPYGALEAALAAPIGGSLSIALAAAWVLSRNLGRISTRRSKRRIAAHFAPMWTAVAHG